MFKLAPYTMTMGLEGLRLNLAVAAVATCAFWLFGYDMSVMVSLHELGLVERTLMGRRAVLLLKSLSPPHSLR